MAKTLSQDLRSRVISAVQGGMSRRAAAERYEIGEATAIRWLREFSRSGATSAKPKGGDRRSHRIEAYAAAILAAIEVQKDISLVELAELLGREHGLSIAPSTVWRFLKRRDITFKKPRMPASRIGPMWQSAARLGSTISPTSIRIGWSSLMKAEPPPRWLACADAPNAANVAAPPSRMGTGRRPPSPARSGCPA